MDAKRSPFKASQPEIERIITIVSARRDDLIKFYQKTLIDNLFSNNARIRPEDILSVSEIEADTLISECRKSFSGARQHGMLLSQSGLSIRTIFDMHRSRWPFLVLSFDEEILLTDLVSTYKMHLLEGFMEATEKEIILEQENIRRAFEIAIRRSNEKIFETQQQLQKATEESHLKTITAQEEERRRISRELHDDAGQAIMGIKLSLEKLKITEPENPLLNAGIDKSIALTDEAMAKIRTVAYSLRPPMLDMLGINLAIKQLCVDFSEQTSLIILYTGVDTGELSDELGISIYRIVQEALTNIVKHAEARRAWIRLQPSRNRIKLNIIDDGKGFDPDELHKGIGLASMRERCRLLNARMIIKSGKGTPTQMLFSFPNVLQQADTKL